MSGPLQDLRYALRQLRRSPGFAITAWVTLALGIGTNTALFSVVNAVLRHPAGVDHPERVAVMHTRYSHFTLDIPTVSLPIFAALRSLDQVEVAAVEQPAGFNILDNGEAEHIRAAAVSAPWFRTFGAQPILGRTFTAEEDQPNAAPVAVVSYSIWQRIFGGRPDVLGKTLRLDDKPYRVVGVMRSDFAWPRRAEIWTPIALPREAFRPDNAFDENYYAFVRLRPGASVPQFNAAASVKAWETVRRISRGDYAGGSGWSVYASELNEFAAGPLRTPLYVLSAVVALVLLIAATNVAGLFLARASARKKEVRIRAALGAGAAHLVRQSLIETVLVAGAASAGAAIAGPLTGRLLLRLVPDRLAAGFQVHLEPAVFFFTAAAALLACLVTGIGPSLAMLRQRRRPELGGSERNTTASVDQQRLRSGFVVGEVALTFLLLAGTYLFLASLRDLERMNPGFNPLGVLAGGVDFAGQNLSTNQVRQTAFVRNAVENLAASPRVRAAAAVEPLPFDPDDGGSCSFDIVGRPHAASDPGPHSQLALATPDYLRVMQIPLVQGRWIGPGDLAGTARVAVIDTRLARKYWPGQNPIGQHISFGCSGADSGAAVVVGVVDTIRLSSLEEDTSDGMRYYAFAQSDSPAVHFVVRADGDPRSMTAVLKHAVASVDSGQAFSDIASLETLVSDSLAGRRLIVWMLTAFAGLALTLAVVGLYGLISFVTAQRTSEVGIRMALGAQRKDVVGLILRSALVRVIIGLSIGVVISIFMSAVLSRWFADFGRGEPVALVVAAGALVYTGLIAGAIPARRASKVDPMVALRYE